MVVDGRRRQVLGREPPLPGDHIPLQTDAQAVMTVGVLEESAEAGEVQGDLGGHCRRAHAGDGEGKVAFHPDAHAVGDGGDVQGLQGDDFTSRENLAPFVT